MCDPEADLQPVRSPFPLKSQQIGSMSISHTWLSDFLWKRLTWTSPAGGVLICNVISFHPALHDVDFQLDKLWCSAGFSCGNAFTFHQPQNSIKVCIFIYTHREREREREADTHTQIERERDREREADTHTQSQQTDPGIMPRLWGHDPMALMTGAGLLGVTFQHHSGI